jgi:hypothetical protein
MNGTSGVLESRYGILFMHVCVCVCLSVSLFTYVLTCVRYDSMVLYYNKHVYMYVCIF